MTAIRKERITSPAAWTRSSFDGDDSWIFHLSDSDCEEIDAAVKNLAALGKGYPYFSRDDFPLKGLAQVVLRISDDLENGRGFCLLRGFETGHYSDAEIASIYYGIGLHLGTPVGQNPQRDLLGTVMNTGDISDKNTRVFQTNLYLPYHTDPSDAVCLLCLQKAREGGLSSLVSAASVYNTILQEYPEYLGVFYRAFHYAHLREDGVGQSPVFSYYDGKLSCRYLRQYIELGHEQREQPLSAVEREALDIFDRVSQAEHMRVDMMLEPGDMQFANNYAVLHSRSAFADSGHPEQRRKLLRLWLKMPNARKLAPDFPGRNGFELIRQS